MQRENIYKLEIPGYAVVQFLNNNSFEKTYCIGFNDFKYYSKKPLWGDGFGPWRESDIFSEDPQSFSNILKKTNSIPLYYPKLMQIDYPKIVNIQNILITCTNMIVLFYFV